MRCIICGNEYEKLLCGVCRQTKDVDRLCEDIISYQIGSGINPVWDDMARSFAREENLVNVLFAVAYEYESPIKEYMQILSICGTNIGVKKASRTWLYEAYDSCKDMPGLNKYQSNNLTAILIDAYYKDYDYKKADELATNLYQQTELPDRAYYILGDFYTQTRRYDKGEKLLLNGIELANGELKDMLEDKLQDLRDRRLGKAAGGKVEYMPASPVNKEIYIKFMETIGVHIEYKTKKIHLPDKLSRDEYPTPVEIRETGFDTFVAFDVETTGRNASIDSMTEIAAIRVVNGQVVESKEFTFQELVYPYKCRISAEVEQLTGITNDMVKDARQMWEVFPDFADFIGDDILVGYNCMAFDSRFLVRAGRYSNRIITNKYFDVMKYAEKFGDRLGFTDKKVSLEALSDRLCIENPQAHRALMDAVTTAKVYLELKRMENETGQMDLDEMLDDIDDW